MMARWGHDVLAVVMIDIDNFTRVDDTRGLAAGDRILMAVADTLRSQAPRLRCSPTASSTTAAA